MAGAVHIVSIKNIKCPDATSASVSAKPSPRRVMERFRTHAINHAVVSAPVAITVPLSATRVHVHRVKRVSVACAHVGPLPPLSSVALS